MLGGRWSVCPWIVAEGSPQPPFLRSKSSEALACAWPEAVTLCPWWERDPPFLGQVVCAVPGCPGRRWGGLLALTSCMRHIQGVQ